MSDICTINLSKRIEKSFLCLYCLPAILKEKKNYKKIWNRNSVKIDLICSHPICFTLESFLRCSIGIYESTKKNKGEGKKLLKNCILYPIRKSTTARIIFPLLFFLIAIFCICRKCRLPKKSMLQEPSFKGQTLLEW